MLKHVAIVGASGGIGQALVQRLTSREDVDTVYALARDTERVPDHPKVISIQCDISDELSIKVATEMLPAQSLDLILVATGVLVTEHGQPEKRLKALSPEYFFDQMTINTLGPILIAQHLLPKLDRNKPAYFAALSARVGSISDNHLGGWYSYRASKAALNMLIKTTAIEFKRTHPHLIIAALHPGTVETGLSKPFQARVPTHKLFTPDYSASCLLDVLLSLSPESSGNVFAWDGSMITP
jgi:NAD(P)-dependent dehydrogenase (short-subunit alcohol dehydrogenase family)